MYGDKKDAAGAKTPKVTLDMRTQYGTQVFFQDVFKILRMYVVRQLARRIT